MDDILRGLNMESLIDVFKDNKVGPTEVLSLTDEEFLSLGVSTIGERVLLRQRCKDELGPVENSPALNRFMHFQSQRKRRGALSGCVENKRQKETLRLRLGWKNVIKGPDIYSLVSASKGGGQQFIDAQRDRQRTELVKQILSIYFPNGINTVQKLKVEDIDYYVATFSGTTLPETINGQPFTVGLYCQSIQTSPVRLFLHTCRKDLLNGVAADPGEGSSQMNDTAVDPGEGTSQMNVHHASVASGRLNLVNNLMAHCTSTDDIASVSQPECMIASGSQPDCAVASVSQPDNGISSVSQRERVIASVSQSDRVIDSVSQPDRVIASVSQPDRVATSVSQLDRATVSVSQPDNAIYSVSPPGCLISSVPQSDRVIASVSQPDNAIGSLSRPDRAINSVSRPDCLIVLDDDELPEINIPSCSGTPTIAFRRCAQSHTATLHEQTDESDDGDETLLDLLQRTREDNATIQEMLSQLEQQIITERANVVNVSRHNVLPGGLRAFKRNAFNPHYQLSVKFVGEDGIDDGGLSREFLRLFLVEISKMSIFGGKENTKMLELNYPALQANTYATVGRILAYSVVHRGPAPTFLSPLLFQAVAVGIERISPTIDDIIDEGHKNLINKVASATDVSEYEDAECIIQLAGCTGLSLSISRRSELVSALIHFVVLGRVKQCFDQFCNGLSTLGVLDAIRINWRCLQELFCYQELHYDATAIEILFKIPDLSPPGSNRRRDEEMVISNWRDFLLDVEDGNEGICLKTILIYATGADAIPTLGFEPETTLQIHDADIHHPESRTNFPYGNTCGNSISVPLLTDYELFRKNMTAAMNILIFTAE